MMMRLRFVLFVLPFALAPAAFAQAPSPAPAQQPPPAETSGGGISGFLEKLKYPLSGGRPAQQTDVPPPPSAATAAAPQKGQPEYMQVTPETKKAAEEAKPKRKKAVKKKTKKSKKKAKTARRKKPEAASREKTEKTGRGAASAPPEPTPVPPPVAEAPPQPAPGPVAEPGTPLGALALYKARMGASDLDGAIAALNGIVRTEPNIEFVALLNETVDVALDVEAANLLVEKIRQSAPADAAGEAAETRVASAHDAAEPSAPDIAALAEYRQKAASGDATAAQAALARFLGHPAGEEATRQANALLGLRAEPSLAQGVTH